MKHAITLIVLAAAAAMTNAQTLLPAKSDIAFSARQMGVPVDGRFTRYSAQVRFHPAKVQQAAVTISIDLGGAAFGSRETEAEIAKSDWFDVTRFPQAIFSKYCGSRDGARPLRHFRRPRHQRDDAAAHDSSDLGRRGR